MSSQEDIISQHSAAPSGSYVLSEPSSKMFPENWRGGVDVPVMIENSIITFSQPSVQL